jgi:hypothetical protein
VRRRSYAEPEDNTKERKKATLGHEETSFEGGVPQRRDDQTT